MFSLIKVIVTDSFNQTTAYYVVKTVYLLKCTLLVKNQRYVKKKTLKQHFVRFFYF